MITALTIRRGLRCKKGACGCREGGRPVHCPICGLRRAPSLAVVQHRTRIVVSCRNGCTGRQIRDGLRGRGLWPSLQDRLAADWPLGSWSAVSDADDLLHNCCQADSTHDDEEWPNGSPEAIPARTIS